MTAHSFADDGVIVTFKEGVSEAEMAAFFNERSLEMEDSGRFEARNDQPWGHTQPTDASQTQEAFIAELAADSRIFSVDPNYERHVLSTPTDTQFAQQWALQNTGQSVNGETGSSGADIGFIEARRLSNSSDDEIVIAIIDTGLDIEHDDLIDNLWTNPGEIADNGVDDDGNGYIDDIHGYDFAMQTAALTDSGDHGTHVAGIIGTVGDNALGTIGVCPEVKIIALKVSQDGETMLSASIIKAMSYAVALKESGVNIVAINASYGGSSSSTAEQLAIEELNAAGIVLCAAAGNDGEDNDASALYPANYEVANVISVAATGPKHALALFSNYGTSTVDIAAPGKNILSAAPLDTVDLQSSLEIDGATYDIAELYYSGVTDSNGVSGNLIDCGLGYEDDFPEDVDGQIALIQRGTITFQQKVTNAMSAGATAAIIYDNTDDALNASSWTLNVDDDDWIPALKLTKADGESLLELTPVAATVYHYRDVEDAYQYMSGTSMAAPMVTGAVAFAALNFPDETMDERIARILDNVTPVNSLSGYVQTAGVLNLRRIVDTDLDSLPDWWETANLGSLEYSGDADPDEDGYTNDLEYLTGTSPSQASSHFALQSYDYAASEANGMSLTFATAEGCTYYVQCNETLDSDGWENVSDAIVGDGSAVTFVSDSLSEGASCFYRVTLSATE